MLPHETNVFTNTTTHTGRAGARLRVAHDQRRKCFLSQIIYSSLKNTSKLR
jgi:hypothetical protein